MASAFWGGFTGGLAGGIGQGFVSAQEQERLKQEKALKLSQAVLDTFQPGQSAAITAFKLNMIYRAAGVDPDKSPEAKAMINMISKLQDDEMTAIRDTLTKAGVDPNNIEAAIKASGGSAEGALGFANKMTESINASRQRQATTEAADVAQGVRSLGTTQPIAGQGPETAVSSFSLPTEAAGPADAASRYERAAQIALQAGDTAIAEKYMKLADDARGGGGGAASRTLLAIRAQGGTTGNQAVDQMTPQQARAAMNEMFKTDPINALIERAMADGGGAQNTAIDPPGTVESILQWMGLGGDDEPEAGFPPQ
jgi:hypothetical protein